jgi:hypothetical protein
MIDFQGQSDLFLPYENIYYLIEQDKVTGIVINDIEQTEPETVNLTEDDVVYSNNKQQYFIRGKGFDYIINNKDNTITITDRSSL